MTKKKQTVSPEEAEIKVEAESPALESEEKTEKKDDNYDRLVRVTADFDNFRKRVQKEKAELMRYGNESLVREILPVMDNFERALEHAQKNSDASSLRSGIEMILSQLQTALERYGVKSESSLGKKFDPLVHEAVSHVEHPESDPNQVIAEHQKAYFLYDRLIRPALVTVAKEPEAEKDRNNTASQSEKESSDKLN